MTNEKKEKEFLEVEAKTFAFGCQLFGRFFKEYASFFMDYPQIFESIKNLAVTQNYQVTKKSKIKRFDKPFGFDQFLILTPMIILPSTLLEIVYGRNEVLNSYLEIYYASDDKHNKFLSLTDLEEVAALINNA